MKLNVEIESGAFEKVIADGIKALTPEELRQIIKQAIYEALTKCESLGDLLVRRQNGWNHDELTLGPLATEAIKSIDLGPEIEELKKKMVGALMDNHRRLVEDMMLRMLVDRVAYSEALQTAIRSTVMQVLSQNR